MAPGDTAAVTKREAPKKKSGRINPYLADTLMQPVPLARSLFHDKINNEQKRADAADGITDNHITFPGNEAGTALLNKALMAEVDRMEIMVENMPANGRDSVMNNQQKIQSLRALWEMLRQYSVDPRPDPTFYRNLVNNMHNMIVAANEHKSNIHPGQQQGAAGQPTGSTRIHLHLDGKSRPCDDDKAAGGVCEGYICCRDHKGRR